MAAFLRHRQTAVFLRAHPVDFPEGAGEITHVQKAAHGCSVADLHARVFEQGSCLADAQQLQVADRGSVQDMAETAQAFALADRSSTADLFQGEWTSRKLFQITTKNF